MIKVEIKPVYKTNGTSTSQAGTGAMPEYLEKTITLFGMTVFRKKVVPVICPGGGYEFANRC